MSGWPGELPISGHAVVFVSVGKARQGALKHSLALRNTDMTLFMYIKH